MNDKIIKGAPSTSNDDYQLNTITLLRHAARSYPEQEVVSRKNDGNLFRYNYGECYDRVKRLANALTELGVKPGDRIGVMEWNTHRFCELYFAISGIGAVLLQLNPRISADYLTYVINHSDAKFICVSDFLLASLFENIAPNLKGVQGYIILSDFTEKSTLKLSPQYDYEKLIEDASKEYEWIMIDERSAYSACYTTGTTGKPKGVYYSHRNIYLHTYAVATALQVGIEDVIMQITPMFHAQGWGFFYVGPLTGAKLVFPGAYTLETLDPLADLLVSEKVTVTCGAPAIFMPMLYHIQKLPKKPDLTGLRMASGASEPPLAMMKGFWELGKAEVIHAYGSTETTPLVTGNILKPSLKNLSEKEKWELKKKQGLIVVGVDVKLVGIDGKEVPHDGKSVGELWIKGPWIAKEYYKDERSEESFQDGYWKSGDMATIDKNGYVKIVDRLKDVIKSGGEWISSVDLENTLMGHPMVYEAAVVGVPHPKWEERPLALVVLTEEGKKSLKKEDLYTFLMEEGSFAKWQLPDDIIFVDEIPKTSVGKIAKKDIKGKYKDVYIKGDKE
ncbi:MAG: long-chain-fatty-acid--CoA ligase [Deferribacterota bacterium]|nr:long-chain-fatty-acid--CoA ligase [Deferribacterota bacterium]